MALKSMTGYGRGTAVWHGMKFVAELASVNRRQLDVQVRLARDIQMLEPQVFAAIRRHLSRGRITGEITLEHAGRPPRPVVEINLPVARACVDALREAGRELGLEDDLRITQLFPMPQVVSFREERLDAEGAAPAVEAALEQALGRLATMRKREGRALQTVLAEGVSGLEKALARIRSRVPEAQEKYRADLLKRIERARLPVPGEDERICKEIVLFAERCDVAEELDRLVIHMRQMRGLFKKSEPVGREMDFLCQEIFREINTLGAKSNDTRIIAEVVSFKADMERFREQVQNIE